MRDRLYDRSSYQLSELTHHYGSNVHLLSNPFLLTQLAALCAKETVQPAINDLVGQIYGDLIRTVINVEMPRHHVTVPTRMIDVNPAGVFQGEVVDRAVRVVVVDIARAGTLPSQVCYDLLNRLLDPRLVRQDHVVMARKTDDTHKVVGTEILGNKVGGDVDDAMLLLPDPMGATGSSISEALDFYRRTVGGKARRVIALHLIVTPEYLRKMRDQHPDLVVYAVRLDRGLSPPEIFNTLPGTHWDQERGLDDRQYIVPGGGGFGEIMNNVYV